MTFVTVAVITALCFVFSSTRKYGVIGTGLLLYFQPYYTVAVLLFAAGAFYEYHRRKNA
jgi:hypothetical protein